MEGPGRTCCRGLHLPPFVESERDKQNEHNDETMDEEALAQIFRKVITEEKLAKSEELAEIQGVLDDHDQRLNDMDKRLAATEDLRRAPSTPHSCSESSSDRRRSGAGGGCTLTGSSTGSASAWIPSMLHTKGFAGWGGVQQRRRSGKSRQRR